LQNIGIITRNQAESFGFSGVLLRSTGKQYDLRKAVPYEVYSKLNFNIITGHNGDCFDRYLQRINEMRESIKIINQCINKMPIGQIKTTDYKITSPSRYQRKLSMETLIHHFKFFSQGYSILPNESYVATEAPKGEFGVYLASNNTSKAVRCKIRAPGFFHLQGLHQMSTNHLLADVVTIIGTQDIVFGEVDR